MLGILDRVDQIIWGLVLPIDLKRCLAKYAVDVSSNPLMPRFHAKDTDP